MQVNWNPVFPGQRHYRVKQIGLSLIVKGHCGGVFLERFRFPPSGSDQILAFIDGHPNQPVLHMIIIVKGFLLLQQLQKNILRDIIGIRRGFYVIECHPVNGINIPLGKAGKMLIRHHIAFS